VGNFQKQVGNFADFSHQSSMSRENFHHFVARCRRVKIGENLSLFDFNSILFFEERKYEGTSSWTSAFIRAYSVLIVV
jgi:hypothetical protein